MHLITASQVIISPWLFFLRDMATMMDHEYIRSKTPRCPDPWFKPVTQQLNWPAAFPQRVNYTSGKEERKNKHGQILPWALLLSPITRLRFSQVSTGKGGTTQTIIKINPQVSKTTKKEMGAGPRRKTEEEKLLYLYNIIILRQCDK